MNAKSLNRDGYQSWPEAVMLGVVSILVIAAALLLIKPSRVERTETHVATHEVARYNTLAGVAGVRALDQDMNPEARYAAAYGVAAVRALDEMTAGSALPSAWVDPHLWRSHAGTTMHNEQLNLNGVAAVRVADRTIGPVESRLNLNGVAAVRALDP